MAFLLTCKQFGVDGVEATTRRALPLVFSRDPAIRTRLVEAADQLFVTGWAGNLFTPAAAARNLMDLASDATLGETVAAGLLNEGEQGVGSGAYSEVKGALGRKRCGQDGRRLG